MVKVGDNFIYNAFIGDKSISKMYYGNDCIWPGTSMTRFLLNDGTVKNAWPIGDLAQSYVPTDVVSAYIGGLVTSIGNNAFANCSNLVNITLPSGLTSIGNYAFQNCTSLSSIILPNGLVNIWWAVFEHCDSLSSVEVPASVERFDNYAFANCENLVSASVSCASTGPNMFDSCHKLSSINLADTVTTIAGSTFANSGVEDTIVHMPNSITAIGEWAFYNSRYAVFDFGNTRQTVPQLGNAAAFEWTPADMVIVVPDALYDTWIDTTNWSSDEVRPHIVKWSDVTRTTYDDSLTSQVYVNGTLSYNSIPNVIHAADIKIGEVVTQIGQDAFKYVKTLSSVYIPDGVSAIGGWAFFQNEALVSAYVPDSVTAIGPCAYSGCIALTSLRLSESLTSIENFSIEKCYSLSSLNVPDSVTRIGDGAFKGSNNIEVFDFGNTRTTIPQLANVNAFMDLGEDYKIVVPDALYENWSLSSTNWRDDSIRPHIIKWSEYYSFRFTAVDPGATVTFHKYGNPADAQIMTSIDAKTWQPYEFGTTITLPNAGDTVYFRAKDENDISFYTDSNNRYWFQTSGADKKIAAAGNIQSLMKAYNKPLDISDKVYCYRGLFQTNKGLVAAPDLPAMALANSCYENMFQLCPALSSAPALPATALANRCYANMFYNCTSLSSAPALSCEQPATACYQNMFGSCSSLTAIPDIPFKKASKWTYQQTFQNCTSISGTVTIKLDPISEIPANSFVWTFETPPDKTPLSVIMDFSDFTAVPLLTNYSTIDVFNNNSDPRLTIKVPTSLLTTWKESSNWSNFADRIIAAT